MAEPAFQTRNDEGEILVFPTLAAARDHALDDLLVWKISFDAPDGSRVRLVRARRGMTDDDDVWVLESIIEAARAQLAALASPSLEPFDYQYSWNIMRVVNLNARAAVRDMREAHEFDPGLLLRILAGAHYTPKRDR